MTSVKNTPAAERAAREQCVQGENTRQVWIPMKTMLAVLTSVFLALCACSSTSAKRELSTHVDRELVLPVGAAQYEARKKQVFFMPAPIDSPMPAYPAALADRLGHNVVLCAEITISDGGAVSSVREIDIDQECTARESPAHQLLFPVTTKAVMRWTYFAAGICNYQDLPTECDRADAEMDAVGVKLAYKFRFRKEGVGLEPVGTRR